MQPLEKILKPHTFIKKRLGPAATFGIEVLSLLDFPFSGRSFLVDQMLSM